MNIAKGAAYAAVGLVVGVGLTVGVLSGQRSPQGQVPASQRVTESAEQQQKPDRLETKNLVFENVKITRYIGELPKGVDVAGELYQVNATITNRSNETLVPSGWNGVTYNLRDGQGRKFERAAFTIGLGDDGLKSTNGILPGQTRENITVGVFDVLPGATGLELGVADGMFASVKYVSPTQPQSSPQSVAAAVPVSSPAPASPAAAPSPTTPAIVSFDVLSPCEQLDSIARSRKPVSEFLVAAARVNDLAKYQAAINSTCPWNAEQLQVADRILNPPVIVTAPVVTVSSGRSSSSSSGSSGGGAPAWNNCNGVQEPGERYSARCEGAQRENDWIIKNGYMKPLNEVDQRPSWRQPSPPTGGDPRPADPPYDRGYSASP